MRQRQRKGRMCNGWLEPSLVPWGDLVDRGRGPRPEQKCGCGQVGWIPWVRIWDWHF